MKYFIAILLLVTTAYAVPPIPTNAVTTETVTVLYNTNRVASLGPSNAVTLINAMIAAGSGSATNGLATTNYVDNSVNSVRTNYARLVEVEAGIFVIYKGQ
jgi:hypothetical protein